MHASSTNLGLDNDTKGPPGVVGKEGPGVVKNEGPGLVNFSSSFSGAQGDGSEEAEAQFVALDAQFVNVGADTRVGNMPDASRPQSRHWEGRREGGEGDWGGDWLREARWAVCE